MGFTKLFSEIITSSIWSEEDKTRIVWVTMLALAGPDGVVRAAIPGLANAARVSVEDCERALEKFQSPDKFSRSQEHEGRRVQRVEAGWLLLNYAKYREEWDQEKRREYKRKWQADSRERRRRKREVRAAAESRERRYVEAVGAGDPAKAGEIAAEGLP